jgi:hypothetical protein
VEANLQTFLLFANICIAAKLSRGVLGSHKQVNITLQYFCVYPKSGHEYSLAHNVFCNQRFEVRGSFLDIGRIVDQHCLIFLFIMKCD